MAKISNADIKKMSFEDALAELENLVNAIESGKVDLEESIQHYTRGSLLKDHCENKLKEAKLKIEEIAS